MVRKGEVAEFEDAVKLYRDLYPIEPKIVKLKPEDIRKYYRARRL